MLLTWVVPTGRKIHGVTEVHMQCFPGRLVELLDVQQQKLWLLTKLHLQDQGL